MRKTCLEVTVRGNGKGGSRDVLYGGRINLLFLTSMFSANFISANCESARFRMINRQVCLQAFLYEPQHDARALLEVVKFCII